MTGLRLALVALAAILGTAAGLASGAPWLLPLLDALPAWLIMMSALRRGRRASAVGLMLWWALWLALSVVTATLWFPQRAAAVVYNGAAYRDEMLDWLATGVGRESDPSAFIPQHLIHAVIFCVLSLASASMLSILMGAVLMNYMSFYVGDLIARCSGSPSQALAVALAWNPWSMIRVVAFIVLGVVLAEPLLSRLPAARVPVIAGRGRWLAAGLAGLALDLILKTLLAPLWPGLLAGCLG